jgi:hypothetical protein
VRTTYTAPSLPPRRRLLLLVNLMQLEMPCWWQGLKISTRKFAIDYVDECNTMSGVSAADDDELEEYVMPRKRPRS